MVRANTVKLGRNPKSLHDPGLAEIFPYTTPKSKSIKGKADTLDVTKAKKLSQKPLNERNYMLADHVDKGSVSRI